MKGEAFKQLLVIDDDRNFRQTLTELLTSKGYVVEQASNGREGLALMHDMTADLVLCDWKMPELDGKGVLEAMAADSRVMNIPVLIMTAYGSGPNALQAMQLGAYDFITKPLDMAKTLETVARALRHVELQNEVNVLRAQRFTDDGSGPRPASGPKDAVPRLVGNSPAWIEVFKQIGKVAKSDIGVLVLGESGTGKEMVARAIHESSSRSRKPFVIVNCAALPPELLESELFGHEKGSFTGAVSQKTGKFEAASSGTIFLDEIGELPLNLQPKLLRVLQEHTFERIGSTVQLHTDVRVLAATNRQLDKDVQAKLFRADLFYRLNTYSLRLPPLRERPSDIVPLAEHFLEQYALRNETAQQGLTDEACRSLKTHSFPGNVRELEHLIERAAVQASGRAITGDLIQHELVLSEASSSRLSLESLLALPFHDAIALLERALLQRALSQTGDNKSEAARVLGVHRRFLYEKLQQHGIQQAG